VLTLFERLPPEELPFYLDLMRHLAAQGLACPQPLADEEQRLFSPLCGKPAALLSRLPGRPIALPDPCHCAAIGDWLARMHLAGAGFAPRIANPRGAAWRVATAARVETFLTAAQRSLLQEALAVAATTDPAHPNAARLTALPRGIPQGDLPRGIVHGDLFRDNALFVDNAAGPATLAGVIDFYFAAEDALLFDLAVAVNDWCLGADGVTLDATLTQALLAAYATRRTPSEAERAAWPAMLCQAALRFWLSRLDDYFLPRQGDRDALVTTKDPADYERILQQRLAAQSGNSATAL